MKRFTVSLFAILCIVLENSFSYAAQPSVWKETRQVSISTGNKTVHLVCMNLNEPKIQQLIDGLGKHLFRCKSRTLACEK